MKVEMSGKQAASGQAPQQPSEEGQRLSKRVMQQKGCSRSVAEQYVEGGWVSVDGEIQEEPSLRVRDEQVVAIAADASLLGAGICLVAIAWLWIRGRNRD